MRRAHEAGPHFHRQAAAGRLLGRRIVVIAEPDAGDEARGIADEPGIAEILAGAGLAGSLPARNLRLPRRARDQRLLHHRVHHRDIARLDRLTAPNYSWV